MARDDGSERERRRSLTAAILWCTAWLAFVGFAAPTGAGAGQGSALTASADVRLAPRAEQATRAWRVGVHRFRESYVHPTSWWLTVDGCRSTGPITQYRWDLRALDGPAPPVSLSSAHCDGTVVLQRLGRWRVQLTVRDSAGGERVVARDVTLRDLLVVSVGDSLSSGEGNPDINRKVVRDRSTRSGFRVVRARWMDRQCHRSARSWSARAARDLQNATTTVTFLNYACSGAEIADIASRRYRGIEPGDALSPQLETVRAQLGLPWVLGTPQVDVLLLTAGVNDLGFGNLLENCAKTPGDCRSHGPAADVRAALPALPGRYRHLDAALSTHVKAAAIYVAEYPSRVFTNEHDRHGGCGAFELGLRSGEAHWITDRGDDLNAALRAAARDDGWEYIGGVRDAFRSHGYCAGARTWFRSYSGSKSLLGDINGTAHPSGRGPVRIADLAMPEIDTGAAPAPPERVRVELLTVRVDDNGATGPCANCRVRVAMLGLPPQQFGALPIGRTVPASGRSISVETHGATLELSAQALVGGRGLPRSLRDSAYLRRDEGWHAGIHALAASVDGRSFRVEYRVSAGPPPPIALRSTGLVRPLGSSCADSGVFGTDPRGGAGCLHIAGARPRPWAGERARAALDPHRAGTRRSSRPR
jgi:hypothetical protein